ncbi:hypothetical protein ABH942_000399 [Flavobacterium sp. 28YEA47A]|uniref:T9SS C-terminal target domain-containing protein n=1 Tax=Flavobacterium sp. 28YEA47A TaxID=3156276 RepID=UPI003510F164
MKTVCCWLVLLNLLFTVDMDMAAQIVGCTDPLSKNYNPEATINDGSCQYKRAAIQPEFSKKLDQKVHETSGLIFWEGKLWTHNDDKDTTIYGLDTISGSIQETYILKNVVNKDWEEISQDNSYLYIGDFGNNVAGNRTNLHILRIDKKSLPLNPVIDTISFRYSDQINFIPSKANKTDYDGEAMIVSKDSIYIFTKQWKSKKTALYSLPKTPGNYVAQLKTVHDIRGLVTGAVFLEPENAIVLCGYSKHLKPFLYLLYDFQGTDFFTGNKRKIKLRLPFHQIEGIATTDGLHYYLTNENFSIKPFINKPQKLHRVDLSRYLGIYIKAKRKKTSDEK